MLRINRFLPFLQGYCPHCLKAKIFQSLMHMNPDCPHCGIHFERESGYFSMSIFLGYMLALLIIIPSVAAIYLIGGTSIWDYALPTGILVILATPWIFRYSRIWWLYLDEWMDPRA